MKSKVSPAHIILITVGEVAFLLLFIAALSFPGSITKFDIQMVLVAYLFLHLIFVVDWYITSRKIFRTVELSDTGISEKSVIGKVTKQFKWEEIKHIYIIRQPFCPTIWLCFTDEKLTKKDTSRALSSKKSIVFPQSTKAMCYVEARCEVLITKYNSW